MVHLVGPGDPHPIPVLIPSQSDSNLGSVEAVRPLYGMRGPNSLFPPSTRELRVISAISGYRLAFAAVKFSLEVGSVLLPIPYVIALRNYFSLK